MARIGIKIRRDYLRPNAVCLRDADWLEEFRTDVIGRSAFGSVESNPD